MAKKKVEGPKGENTERPMTALERLKSKAKPAAEPKPAAKKRKRPTIALTESKDIELFELFASSDIIAKMAEAAQKESKDRAKALARSKFFPMALELGYMPDNPSIQTAAAKATFAVVHVAKFNRTSKDGKEVLSVDDHLKQLGFDDKAIVQVKSCIKEKEHLGMKKFTDLQAPEASAAMKSVADKVMNFILEELDDEERELILEPSIDTSVTDNWQDVAVDIAKRMSGNDTKKGVDLLNKLFTVISPQYRMSQVIFSGELSNALVRMQSGGTMSGGTMTERKVIENATKTYKSVIEGNAATLYKVKPDGEEEIITKNFENSNHAEMQSKRWFKDPDALAEVLAEAKSAK